MDHPKSATGAAFLLFVGALRASTVSVAEPSGGVRTEDVSFRDLDLDTGPGVAVAYGRIHAAALRVCSVSVPAGLGAASAAAQCSRDAQARAIDMMNVPALTAFAAAR